MQLIDGEGNLFGLVNVIDALVVLVFVALVTAGVGIVAGGSSGTETESLTVTYEATVHPAVADASASDRAMLDGGTVVDGPLVVDQWTNETTRQEYERIRLEASVPVTVTEDGTLESDGDRLYVGQKTSVDLGITRFSATVTEIKT